MDEGTLAGAEAVKEEEAAEEVEEEAEEEVEEEVEVEYTRAFKALSLAEEKHAMLARAHFALAAKRRWGQLLEEGYSEKTIELARSVYDTLWEELGEEFCTAASEDVIANAEVIHLMLRIPDCGSNTEILHRVLGRSLWILQSDYRDYKFLTDRALVTRLVKTHGAVLGLASDELCAEKNLVLNAVKSDATALKYASEALKEDREVVLAALRSKEVSIPYEFPWPLYVDIDAEDLWDDKEVVLAAVENNPHALAKASGALRHDREVVLAALRAQTAEAKANPDGVGGTLFGVVRDPTGTFLIDQEILLEAVKVDGSAIQYGSEELRLDKDFLIQAMRNAVDEEQQRACYNEAHESIRRSILFEECLGAASSVLAVPGELAPVLNISLETTSSGGSSKITSCDVSLLSGTTFTCCLSSGASSTDLPEIEVEPPHKRPKLAGPDEQTASKSGEHEQTQSLLTVSQLADIVLEELPRHVEVDPLPERVFIVVVGEEDHVAVTPWDWNRPLPLTQHG